MFLKKEPVVRPNKNHDVSIEVNVDVIAGPGPPHVTQSRQPEKKSHIPSGFLILGPQTEERVTFTRI